MLEIYQKWKIMLPLFTNSQQRISKTGQQLTKRTQLDSAPPTALLHVLQIMQRIPKTEESELLCWTNDVMRPILNDPKQRFLCDVLRKKVFVLDNT